jgi:hypothetical protein
MTEEASKLLEHLSMTTETWVRTYATHPDTVQLGKDECSNRVATHLLVLVPLLVSSKVNGAFFEFSKKIKYLNSK